MAEEEEEDDDVFTIMVATDSHLGYCDRDAVRGTDSFAAFEEVLRLANDRGADFLLLAGDLFHDNKPSRRTLFKTMSLLRRYALSDAAVGFEVLSDQEANFRRGVNYEDPHVSVGLPIFSIHGNHDDPTREGGVEALAALDLLSVANMLNYFGRQEHADRVEVSPVLLRKGNTRVALYGLGNMRDERLNRMWQQKKVRFLRPRDGTYFSIFVLHQNRDVGRGRNTCVHESMIPAWIDLVIWGHEHECQIKPRESAVGTFRVCQPGSSVACSLVEGEAKPKHCGLLQVRGAEFRMSPLRLTCVRPFVCDEIVLAEAPELRDDADADDGADHATAVRDCLAARVEALIERARQTRSAFRYDDMLLPMAAPDQVLVRLKVDHTGFATLNNAKFGGQFVGRVANTSAILHFSRQKQASASAAKTWVPTEGGEPVEEGELAAAAIDQLIQDQLDGQEAKLQILEETKMNEALNGFVDKQDPQAFAEEVERTLVREQKAQYKRGDATDPESIRARYRQAPPPAKKAPAAVDASSGEDSDDAPRKPAKKKPAARGRKKAAAPPSSEDEDSEDEAPPPPRKRAARASRARKQASYADDDDDDEEEEEDDEEDDASADASPPPKKKRGARKQAPWKDPAPRAPPKAPQPASIDMTGWDSD